VDVPGVAGGRGAAIGCQQPGRAVLLIEHLIGGGDEVLHVRPAPAHHSRALSVKVAPWARRHLCVLCLCACVCLCAPLCG
jgi:hypothetical protein